MDDEVKFVIVGDDGEEPKKLIAVTKLDVAKWVTGWVIGSGVSFIVVQVIDQYVLRSSKKDEMLVYLGRLGITMMVKDAVQDSIDQRFDSYAQVWTLFKSNYDYVMKDPAPTETDI